MERILRIGEVAARTGVSCDTVRYYERLGLVPKPARTDAGYRQYPESAVRRISRPSPLQFGFSLEIGAFLRVREHGGAPSHDVRAAAERLLAEVDAGIRALTAVRRRMRATLKHWDRRLARTPDGRPARAARQPASRVAAAPRRGLATRSDRPRLTLESFQGLASRHDAHSFRARNRDRSRLPAHARRARAGTSRPCRRA